MLWGEVNGERTVTDVARNEHGASELYSAPIDTYSLGSVQCATN